VRVLLNQHVVFAARCRIWCGGLPTAARTISSPLTAATARALQGARRTVLQLLLATTTQRVGAATPDFNAAVRPYPRGQFLPWNFFVRLQQPFVRGLNRLRGLWCT